MSLQILGVSALILMLSGGRRADSVGIGVLVSEEGIVVIIDGGCSLWLLQWKCVVAKNSSMNQWMQSQSAFMSIWGEGTRAGWESACIDC